MSSLLRMPLVLALSLFASNAVAGTVFQELDYRFLGGPRADTVLEVRYSYEALLGPGPGGADVEGTVRYLGDEAEITGFVVFETATNPSILLNPEPWISASFDPATSPTGLREVFINANIRTIGVFFEGDPDILWYETASPFRPPPPELLIEVEARTFPNPVPPGFFDPDTPAPVPLPPAAAMLLAGLGGLVWLGRHGAVAGIRQQA